MPRVTTQPVDRTAGAGDHDRRPLARFSFNPCSGRAQGTVEVLANTVGTVGCTRGVRGRALSLTGQGYLAVETGDLTVTEKQPRSYALWVRPTDVPSIPGNAGLLSQYRHYHVGVSNFYASLYDSGGRVVTRLTADGTNVLEAEVGQLGVWQHYVFTMQAGEGGTRIYRNGSLVAEGTLSYNNQVSPEPFLIGNIVGAEDDQRFRGQLDEVVVFDHVLSAESVRKLSRGGHKQSGSS